MDDKKMTIVLNSAFATPEDVGKELGVPKARVKWLKRFISSQAIFSGKMNGKRLRDKNGTRASVSAKKKTHARAKAKKVAH